MARVFVLLTTCVAFVHSVNNFLVQGRADTLKVLRRIIKERDHKVMPHDPFGSAAAWQPGSDTVTPITAFQPVLPRDVNSRSFHEAVEADKKLPRNRRDIRQVVIESGHCEHIELIDCSDFETDDRTCLFTATGYDCCVCTGASSLRVYSLSYGSILHNSAS